MLVKALLAAATLALPFVGATSQVAQVGPAFPLPDFDLGTASPAAGAAKRPKLYCNLKPAKKCQTDDAYLAYDYLYNLGAEGVDCGIAGVFAETGIEMVVEGTASVLLTTQRIGNVTMSCTTAANLLYEIITYCPTGSSGQLVKGLVQVPPSMYTAEGFTPEARTVSIVLEHV